MNFDFSDDVKTMRDEAAKFLRDRSPPSVVRRILDGAGRQDAPLYDAQLWRSIAEMGWTAVAIPEEFGGIGLGYEALCVLAEQLGASLAPVPFSSSVYLAAEAILAAGTEAQKGDLLPLLASGERVWTFAVAEGAGDPSPAMIEAEVRDGLLYGMKSPVPDGEAAHEAIVVARDRGAIGLFRVRLDGDGVTRTRLNMIDPSRGHAAIRFDGAPAEPLADRGDGWGLVQRLLDRAAILVAFEQVGGAQACLDMARAYALDRYAFGRSIASFQAIKHKLADLFVAIELARTHAYYGAWALAHDAPELPLAAAAARVSATDAYHLASKENIQTHGGMGFTWEIDCHLYYRRAKLLALTLGGPLYWKDRLMNELVAAAE